MFKPGFGYSGCRALVETVPSTCGVRRSSGPSRFAAGTKLGEATVSHPSAPRFAYQSLVYQHSNLAS